MQFDHIIITVYLVNPVAETYLMDPVAVAGSRCVIVPGESVTEQNTMSR
jgi:hypothetical protein